MRSGLVILAAFLLSPMAYAHEPKGTPKFMCETPGEWAVHEYVGDASGTFLFVGWDATLFSDCGNTPNPLDGACFDPDGIPQTLAAMAACGQDVLSADPTLYDGHHESAYGGAWLLACDSSCGPGGAGRGALACFREGAHHPELGRITVDDAASGSSTQFIVAVDEVDVTGLGGGCGDGLADRHVECMGTCVAPFRAGLDGSYQVHVQGTGGHVIS